MEAQQAGVAAAKAELQAALDASEKGGARDYIFGGAAKLFDNAYEDPNEAARRSARAQLEKLNSAATPPAAVPTPAVPATATGPSPEAHKIAGEVLSGARTRGVPITNEQVLAQAFAKQMGAGLASPPLTIRGGGGGLGTNGFPRAAGNDSGSTPR